MKPTARSSLLALVILAVTIPFVPLILWSLSQRWFYPNVLPNTWGFRAWEYVFGIAGPQIVTALIQSIILSVGTALVSLAISIPAGRVLGLYHFRGKNLILMLLTLPLIVPALSVAMGLHLWFLRLGLADSIVGVVLVHLTICIPYAAFVM